MKDLREKTIRAACARICAQAANFLLRVGSLMILARLLDPTDFGLVGMVTAITGVLDLFRDFGLSAASVQRAVVTEEQTSTLFWVNVLVGGILTLFALALAPFVGIFYHEPRLFWVTSIVAIGFILNGAGIQHSALLQRQMRFTALAIIDVSSLVIGVSIAIGMAKAGYGYWALVANTVSYPLTTTLGLWLATKWVPGRPRRRVGIRSMLRFGGTMTLHGLVLYVTFNLDKILLGRFWGAEAIGIYGRASQLVGVPVDNLNSAVGAVSFAALSRLQDDPERLKRYFVRGYSLVVTFDFADHDCLRSFFGRSDSCASWTKVERCSGDLSYSGSDNFGLCHSQPPRLAAQFAWSGRAKLKDRFSFRALYDFGVRNRVALRTRRCRTCLFGGNGIGNRPDYCVGGAWHRNFRPRYFVGPKSSAGIKRRSRGYCFWSASFLRPDVVSGGPTPFRDCFVWNYLSRSSLVECRRALIIPGSHSQIGFS